MTESNRHLQGRQCGWDGHYTALLTASSIQTQRLDQRFSEKSIYLTPAIYMRIWVLLLEIPSVDFFHY